MTLSSTELEACDRVVTKAGAEKHPYADHRFNVHRWLQAYEGDEEETARVLRRHLSLRDHMKWCEWPDRKGEEFDGRVDVYAPLNILGKNRPDDNKILLFEQSGKIDIHGLIDNVKVTSFMRAKFRMMERIHRKVVEEEKSSGKQSGAMLVMDLDGLSFQPSLLPILAGAYRIMWGTLFEQYPQIISHIIIVNAPKFINLLYSTCIPFIPSDYRSRMVICSSPCPRATLLSHIHSDCLPKEYGGEMGKTEQENKNYLPQPLAPFPEAKENPCTLESITVSAGCSTIQTYKWTRDTRLRFLMKHSQEFDYFIFHSKVDTDDQTHWEEIYAGCERPALKQTDDWEWRVPHDGYYHVRYGNEKAWFYSVTVQYSISSLLDNGEEELQVPLATT